MSRRKSTHRVLAELHHHEGRAQTKHECEQALLEGDLRKRIYAVGVQWQCRDLLKRHTILQDAWEILRDPDVGERVGIEVVSALRPLRNEIAAALGIESAAGPEHDGEPMHVEQPPRSDGAPASPDSELRAARCAELAECSRLLAETIARGAENPDALDPFLRDLTRGFSAYLRDVLSGKRIERAAVPALSPAPSAIETPTQETASAEEVPEAPVEAEAPDDTAARRARFHANVRRVCEAPATDGAPAKR